MTTGSPSVAPLNRFANGLLRFFPYEAVSWRRSIAQSGLPDEVQVLIRKVVRKSRLFRFEKVEVTHELISHFWEGQQSGRGFSELVAEFGDPALTARMIHRSKSRSRPIMFRAFQILGGLTLALAGGYLAVMAYFHAGRPQPTTDFMVEFNRPMREMPEEDKAWPIYRPAWIQFGFSEGGKMDVSALFHPDDNNRPGRLIKPEDPGWPAAVARLEELQELLDAFRLGARRPALGLELQADISRYSDEDFAALFPNRERGSEITAWDESENLDDGTSELLDQCIVGVLLPHIQSFRNAARIFVVDTRWAIEQNDPARASENIQTMLGLARQATDSNTLVGTLSVTPWPASPSISWRNY